MTLVTAQDLTNLKTDADTVSEFVNENKIVTSRTGSSYKSIAKIVQDSNNLLANIGFEVPVNFASGLTAGSSSFTVNHNDIIYYANPNQTPFTTTSTFDSNQWLVLQTKTSVIDFSQYQGTLLSRFVSARNDALARNINTIFISEDIVLSSNVDLQGVALTGNYNVLNLNSFDLRNAGPIIGFKASGTGRFLGKAFRAPSIPSNKDNQIIYKENDRIYVIGKGSGVHGVLHEYFTGNIVDPALPSRSENGSWALWRCGIHNAVKKAYVWKSASSESGTWVNYNIPLGFFQNGNANIQGFKPMKARHSTTPGNSITYIVDTKLASSLKIAFFTSGTSPSALDIQVNGTVRKTAILNDVAAKLKVIDIEVTPGQNTIYIEHPVGAGNMYIVGCNFQELAEIKENDLDVDNVAVYTISPTYDYSRGSSDYAIKTASNNIWAGSYHGGETARQPAEFSIDGSLVNMTNGDIIIGKRFSILQQTTLSFSNGQTCNVDSLNIAAGSEYFIQAAFSNCNIVAATVQAGMFTTSDSFDSFICGVFENNATTNGTSYAISDDRTVTQIERSTGRLVSIEFDTTLDLNTSHQGGTISYARNVYAKFYTGTVRNTLQQLPEKFAFAMKVSFS